MVASTLDGEITPIYIIGKLILYISLFVTWYFNSKVLHKSDKSIFKLRLSVYEGDNANLNFYKISNETSETKHFTTNHFNTFLHT